MAGTVPLLSYAMPGHPESGPIIASKEDCLIKLAGLDFIVDIFESHCWREPLQFTKTECKQLQDRCNDMLCNDVFKKCFAVGKKAMTQNKNYC